MADQNEKITLERNICSHKIFAILFLLVSISILTTIIIYKGLITQEYIWLFLWSFASGLLGFAVYIFRKIPLMREGAVPNESPIPSYIYYYPFSLFVMVVIVVFILTFIIAISDNRFYIGTFALMTILGLNIDIVPIMPLKLIDIIKSKIK